VLRSPSREAVPRSPSRARRGLLVRGSDSDGRLTRTNGRKRDTCEGGAQAAGMHGSDQHSLTTDDHGASHGYGRLRFWQQMPNLTRQLAS
jgi:hypothetical protein